MELWDLDRAVEDESNPYGDQISAQTFLVVARGSAPQGYYNTSSGAWSFVPPTSLSDVAGQSLLRPYLKASRLYCRVQLVSDSYQL